MKLLTIIVAALVALSLPSFAAKGGKNAGKRGEFRRVLKAYDKNRNRQIDGTEVKAVKNAYGTFKRIDANSDGGIADDEIKSLNAKIEATKPKARKATGEQTKKRKKKKEKAG